MGASRLVVTARSARVVVRAASVSTISVVGGNSRTVGDDVEVSTTSRSVEVVVPEGTDVVIGVGSGNVDCFGKLGSVSATSHSGRITVESAREVDARTESGRIVVGTCDELCRSNARSGRIEIGSARTVEATTMSGRIDIEAAEHSNASAVSGKITIGACGVPDVVARTASGAVSVTLPPGLKPATRLESGSGSVRCDCELGDDGLIVVATKGGAIKIASRR